MGQKWLSGPSRGNSLNQTTAPIYIAQASRPDPYRNLTLRPAYKQNNAQQCRKLVRTWKLFGKLCSSKWMRISSGGQCFRTKMWEMPLLTLNSGAILIQCFSTKYAAIETGTPWPAYFVRAGDAPVKQRWGWLFQDCTFKSSQQLLLPHFLLYFADP